MVFAYRLQGAVDASAIEFAGCLSFACELFTFGWHVGFASDNAAPRLRHRKGLVSK